MFPLISLWFSYKGNSLLKTKGRRRNNVLLVCFLLGQSGILVCFMRHMVVCFTEMSLLVGTSVFCFFLLRWEESHIRFFFSGGRNRGLSYSARKSEYCHFGRRPRIEPSETESARAIEPRTLVCEFFLGRPRLPKARDPPTPVVVWIGLGFEP